MFHEQIVEHIRSKEKHLLFDAVGRNLLQVYRKKKSGLMSLILIIAHSS